MTNILSNEQIKKYYHQVLIDSHLSLSCLNKKVGKMIANKIKKRFANPNLSFFILIGRDSNKYGFELLEELKHYYKNVVCFYNTALADLNEILKQTFDVIIDCFLPVESEQITDNEKKVLHLVNQAKAYKIAIDLPSGIIENNGVALEDAFLANLCYAIQFYRYGHFFNDGMDYYQKIEVLKIFNQDTMTSSIHLLDAVDFKNILPKRKHHSNKGSYGKCVLISGCKETPGAALLASKAYAALKVGIGYATIAIPNSLYPLYALQHPENIYYLLDDENGHIQFQEQQLMPLLQYDVVTIGMGLSNHEATYQCVQYFLKHYEKTLILDADALNALSMHDLSILNDKKCQVILTPHLKEFSRLLHCELSEIEKSPVDLAMAFAKKYQVVLLLKSHVHLIADSNHSYIVNNGNPCLAKAGSGDVVSGILTGLCGYLNYQLSKVVAIACYVLGMASNSAIVNESEYSITASDIIQQLGKVMKKLQRKDD